MQLYKKIIDKDLLVDFLFALEAFFSINPYLLWETYEYYKYFDILKMVVEISIILLIISKVKMKIDSKSILMAMSFCVVYFYYICNTYNHQINIGLGTIIKLIMLCLFFTLTKENKKKTFKIFLSIFAISLVPGIIYSILNMLKIEMRCDYIQTTQAIKKFIEQHYKHYFGCVFRESIYYSPTIKQLCGMYDEPGMVGTISALLLCASSFDFKKHKALIVILIGGIMSMSLTFFMLCTIYFCYYTYRCFATKQTKKFKKIAFVIVIAIIALFLLKNNQVFQEKVVRRFSLSYLMDNNRVSDEFSVEFDNFLKNGNLFFGLGNNNPIFDKVDAASYKVLIYNIGIFGFILLIGWFLYWGIKKSEKNKECIFFIVIFLISIYQRPWILYMYFILIYFGGIEMIKEKTEKEEVERDGNKEICV